MVRLWKLGNYYAEITIKKTPKRFYWILKDYTGENRIKIPESLYKELIKFENDKSS